MAIVALTHKEFECPKYLIHEPPLVYEGSIGWRSSSNRLRSCLPFASDTWRVIFQISLHSLFLSKSQDDLHGNKGVKLNIFVSLSTMEWRGQLSSLGQSQNSMEFEGCLLKNPWDLYQLMLIRMDQWVENSISHMYGVHDDNYVRDTWDLNGLVDATPDSKQFSFCGSNADCMMYHFLDRIWEWMDVQNWCSYVVLDTSILNYDDRFGIGQSIENTFIKLANMSSLAFFVSVICLMEWKATRKDIN